MAPKRAKKVVVRSTRKVVKETVQVSVVSSSKRSTRANKDEQEGEGNTSTIEENVRIIPVQQVTPETEAPKENASPIEKKEAEGKTEQEADTQIDKGNNEAGNDGRGRKEMKKTKKRGRRSGEEGYRRYVYKVLKQVHPEMGISFQAMTILNNLMCDMFERLADEAARLKEYTGHMTLSCREIQGAVKLVLPGELGKHAIAEGAKAVTNYMSNDARH